MPLLQPGESWRMSVEPPFSQQDVLELDIAGCEPQSQPIQLRSGATTTLIIDGCGVRALAPE
ncbi:MAG TPA: hypothetical protein VG943_05205 [Caulobacterales bacterium]|nr:hypothetical protein [Caulobacterales bacterium]